MNEQEKRPDTLGENHSSGKPSNAGLEPMALPVPIDPGSSRFERREKAAMDALRALLRDLYAERIGGMSRSLESFDLRLGVHVDPAKEWSLSFHPPLFEQLCSQVDELGVLYGVYMPGRVYSFYDESPHAATCIPPSALSVFSGFDSKGVPQWCDLAQALICAGDERIDLLYDRKPKILSLVQYGRELKAEQLRSFGRTSKTYSILCQVVVGYFLLPVDIAGDGEQRLALTFQAVETRKSRSKPCLHLNMISYLSPELLEEWLTSTAGDAVLRAYKIAEEKIARLEQQLCPFHEKGRADQVGKVMSGIPGILKRLAVSLERGERQMQRRTRHARRRRLEDRPVRAAMSDVLEASGDTLFVDEKTNKWIACGAHRRAHVFTREGQLVTSFTLKPGAIEFRLRTNRWRKMSAEEQTTFRDVLGRMFAGDSRQPS